MQVSSGSPDAKFFSGGGRMRGRLAIVATLAMVFGGLNVRPHLRRPSQAQHSPVGLAPCHLAARFTQSRAARSL